MLPANTQHQHCPTQKHNDTVLLQKPQQLVFADRFYALMAPSIPSPSLRTITPIQNQNTIGKASININYHSDSHKGRNPQKILKKIDHEASPKNTGKKYKPISKVKTIKTKRIVKKKQTKKVNQQKASLIRCTQQILENIQSTQSFIIYRLKAIHQVKQSWRNAPAINWMAPQYNIPSPDIKKIRSIFKTLREQRRKKRSNESGMIQEEIMKKMQQKIYGMKLYLLQSKTIHPFLLQYLQKYKSRIQNIKQKTEKQTKTNNDQTQCKFCGIHFADAQQMGGHIAKKHPGQSNQFTNKVINKTNKQLECMRREYFRFIDGSQGIHSVSSDINFLEDSLISEQWMNTQERAEGDLEQYREVSADQEAVQNQFAI